MAMRLLIGAPWADGIGDGKTNAGETYLISGVDLVALDQADGTEDGVIDLANVQNGTASYRFVGADAYDWSGYSVSSAGDVDKDGHADLLIGARQAMGIGNGKDFAGETYLISGAELVALDGADGTVDGVIDLANVQNGTAPIALSVPMRMTVPGLRYPQPVMWMGMATLIC